MDGDWAHVGLTMFCSGELYIRLGSSEELAIHKSITIVPRKTAFKYISMRH